MSSGGGYSGGMGGYGGGFGGGFGQPPQFGGGFGGGFGQPPQFGGGFGGGFGQPPQYGGGFGSPYGGFGGGFGQPQQFGGGFGQPQQSPFGGGFQRPMLQDQGITDSGNAYAKRFQRPSVGMFPPTSPDPNQPPPGMELNPDYTLPPDTFTTANTPRGRFRPIQARTGTDQPPPGMMLNPEYGGDLPPGTIRSLGPDSIKYVPDPNQPQPQTGGGYGGGTSTAENLMRYGLASPFGSDIQYAGGTPGFYEAQLQAQQRPAGSFLGGPYDPAGGYFGGYGGGYSSPYMSPSMMGGLASLFGGMQGGGFQGMFNPQSQAEAQMRAYQQYQQRDPNQPPPGMKLNPTYDAGYAMAQDMPLPGSPQALRKQQFIPI